MKTISTAATMIFVALCVTAAVVSAVSSAASAGQANSPLSYRDEALLSIGSEAEGLIERGFVAFDPAYKEHKAVYGERLDALARRLASIQAAGAGMRCSTQIFLEAKWLYHYTADWSPLKMQLDRLEESLDQGDQALAAEQSHEDGSWGACHDEWFHKVEATYHGIHELFVEGSAPRYPIRLFDRHDTPSRIRSYLEGLVISDIAQSGRDNRAEIGAMTTIFSIGYFKDYLQDYLNHEVEGIPRNRGEFPLASFVDAYEGFLVDWQDPETGFWGAWYRSDGRVHKTTDLSITYHTVAYRKGDVHHWPKIIDTLFRIKFDPYPYGWMHGDRRNNHNNYDVARIFRYGWPHMTPDQRERAKDEIGAMLEWSLENSLLLDGSFVVDPTFFSSLSGDNYFGVSFFDEIGFFDQKRRFWTDRELPGGGRICCLIKARLEELGFRDSYARGAEEKLNRNCSVC